MAAHPHEVGAPFAVHLRGVTKVFPAAGEGTLTALDDVSIDIAPSEFAVLRGRSGSGKTTLLNIVAGLTTPTTGSVMLDDIDLWRLSDAGRSRLRNEAFGFVFQFPSLMPTLTVFENILLPAAFGNRATAEMESRAAELLEIVGIPDKAQAYPRQLSAGQQQRVVIARALVHRPRLILADEPTSNLDEQTESEIFELFHDLHERTHATIIMVTHALAPLSHGIREITLAAGHLAK